MWFDRKIKPDKIKKKNTRELRLVGIEVIEHLPVLEEPEFSDSAKVARRMMVLLAIFQLWLRAPNELIKKWLVENGLITELTEEELSYLESDYADLPEQSQIDIYWYIEAIWAFAWIGGLHNNLTLNTGVEDSLKSLVPDIQKNEFTAAFISAFKLRSRVEIFEMLDKFYRAHWFARHINLAGKTSDKVDLDIIIERRKALEYTCYRSLEWDKITLDT